MIQPQMFSRVSLLGLFLSLFCGMAYSVAAETDSVVDLETAFSAVLSKHPAMSGKQAEVSASVYDADVARAARLPSLTAQAGRMYQEGNGELDGQNTLTLRLRQPIWAFGKIDSGIESADASIQVHKSDLLKVKRDLLDKVASAYARVYGISLRLQVVKNNIETLDDLYQQIMRRESGQLASKADVRMASLRLNQAKGKKRITEGELSVALSDLHALIQIPVTGVSLVDAEFTELSINGLQQQIEANSANLQHKHALLQVAKANIDKDTYSSMPVIYLQAERNFNQLGYLNATRYGVVIEGNVDGVGFAASGRSKAATARATAASESLAVARNDLKNKVNSLIANRQAQQDFISEQVFAIKDIEAVSASYFRQYEAGAKQWLDVLNIQREMTDMRNQKAQAESDWLLHCLQLKIMSGAFDGIELSRKGQFK